jgi:cysteine desulfurase family protein (TIGR01976 family)
VAATDAAGPGLDVEALRARFPALGLVVDGSPAVYLDGAGGSGGDFVTSTATDALLWRAREAAADFLGATPEEIVLGANTTTTNFQLAHAVARTLLPGDEILVTELDHDANVAPWLLVAADHGLVVRTVPLDRRDGTLDHEALAGRLSPRTRVVACTLASNALGSITDVPRLAAAVRGTEALLWVDAVHLAPHRRLDRRVLGADVILTSPYKYFGPHLGVAAVRADLAASLPADRVRPADEQPAGHRFETGTLGHEGIAGFVAAVEYLASLGGDRGDRASRLDAAFARIEAYELTLTRRTLERLREIRGCSVYGIADPDRAAERTPTFCFNLEGWAPQALSAELGRRGLFTYHGNYYALGAMTALGLEAGGGAVRAGYLHYTSPEEVERFCDVLASLT